MLVPLASLISSSGGSGLAEDADIGDDVDADDDEGNEDDEDVSVRGD